MLTRTLIPCLAAVFAIIAFGCRPNAPETAAPNMADGDRPWPSAVDPATGVRVYQLTDRPGNNMAFYYIFNSEGAVGGTPYLAYRNATGGWREESEITYYSINLETGEETALCEPGQAGFIAEVRGEWLYALSRGGGNRGEYTHLSRFHLATAEREDLFALEPGRRYSANLAVDAAGEIVLFFSPSGEPGRIDLFAGRVSDGTVFTVLEGEPISHIQFSPAEPGYFTYLHQPSRRAKRWTAVGVGRIDAATGTSKHFLLDPQDPFFAERPGELVASHPFFDAAGDLMVDFVDTTRPYTDEFVIRLIPDWDNPGRLASFDYVNLEMGDFQTHFNYGPDASMFVGDGESADWWHKPGFGEPFIQKLAFDYATHEMTRFPMASNAGAHWKTGQYEANARYVGGARLLVWNTFRTLDGVEAVMDQYATVEERPEREEQWLYTAENPVKQNVFAVDFFAQPKPVSPENFPKHD